MNIGRFAAVAALGMALLASPALAKNTDTQFGYLNGGWEDYTGISTIGVDVSHVGWAPSAAREFVAGLGPERAQSVTSACDYALDHQTSYHTEVLMFCHNLIGR
jgi:hypothetical protein